MSRTMWGLQLPNRVWSGYCRVGICRWRCRTSLGTIQGRRTEVGVRANEWMRVSTTEGERRVESPEMLWSWHEVTWVMDFCFVAFRAATWEPQPWTLFRLAGCVKDMFCGGEYRTTGWCHQILKALGATQPPGSVPFTYSQLSFCETWLEGQN